MKKLIILVIIIFFEVVAYSQISPILDNNWVKVSSKSDDFSGNELDYTKWDTLCMCPNLGMYAWGGGQIWNSSNVVIENNQLNLIVTDIAGVDEYHSGGIRSKNHDYSYGYFEISAKLPGYHDATGDHGRGFFPAFWTYYQQVVNGCITIHDEIDILEPNGTQYADAKINDSGVHDELACSHEKVSGHIYYYSDEALFEDFHKYAVEWLPDRIIFYFDDQPYYTAYDYTWIDMESQYVVIDQQVDENVGIPYLNDAYLPDTMHIDYFNYYQMNTTNCNQTISIDSQASFENLNGVYNNITIGDPINSISLSQNKIIRYSNSIELSKNFSVPLGKSLSIIQTPCF